MNKKETSDAKLTFYQWVSRFKDEEHEIGAFARVAIEDRSFPTGPVNYEELEAYLKAAGAYGAGIILFQHIWLTYLLEVNSAPTDVIDPLIQEHAELLDALTADAMGKRGELAGLSDEEKQAWLIEKLITVQDTARQTILNRVRDGLREHGSDGSTYH